MNRARPRRHRRAARRRAVQEEGPVTEGVPVTDAPSPWRGISFEERMATVDFRVGARPHITVDSDVCRSCTTRACVSACPANLFAPTADGGILFNYEECFECGTCYLVCNQEGAITWTYPDGGFGVVFHAG